MTENIEEYPRSLNGHGCIYGRTIRSDLDELKIETRKKMGDMNKKLDKILWAMTGVLIALTTSSIMITISLVTP